MSGPNTSVPVAGGGAADDSRTYVPEPAFRWNSPFRFQPAQGPNIGLKTQLSNVPQSSAVMGGVG